MKKKTGNYTVILLVNKSLWNTKSKKKERSKLYCALEEKRNRENFSLMFLSN